MKKLAIIIPAYKAMYLESTLNSFVSQTESDFNIYIGDDNSPEDIYSIVKRFRHKLNIKYIKFEENIGSNSLTKQWERCIELSNEEWVWLFSDDDIASPYCVEVFYKSVSNVSKFYKFHTSIINGEGTNIRGDKESVNKVENYITSQDFIDRRLDARGFRSFAVEYIFHRSLYDKLNFVDFPMAWASDDASWLIYSLENSKKITILDEKVFWRLSDSNISSKNSDNIIVSKKIIASINFINWLRNYNLIGLIILDERKMLRWLSIQIASLEYHLSYHDYKKIIEDANINASTIVILKYFFLVKFYHIKNRYR